MKVSNVAQTNGEAWQKTDQATIAAMNVVFREAYPAYELKDFANPDAQPTNPENGYAYLVYADGECWGQTVLAKQIICRVDGAWTLLHETIDNLHDRIAQNQPGERLLGGIDIAGSPTGNELTGDYYEALTTGVYSHFPGISTVSTTAGCKIKKTVGGTWYAELETSLLSLKSRITTNETDISTLRSETRNTINDIANLAAYNSNGKTRTYLSGTTVTNSRLGIKIPVNYKASFKVRINATKNTINGSLYWLVETEFVQIKTIVWVSDGAGGYYFETILTAAQYGIISDVFCQHSSTGALSADNTISFVTVSFDETIQEWSVTAGSQITELQSDITDLKATTEDLTEKQAEIDTVLKNDDLDISAYATKQTITLTEGQTTATRVEWNIPIAKLKLGDKIRIQLKSVNGNNAGSLSWFKYGSTGIGALVWTLNTGDGFYYSQLIEIVVSQSDLDTYTTFVVLMQANNSSGLHADTITNAVQYVSKVNYIDVKALKAQVDNMVVPTNLLNTLEIPFRGYSAMTPIKVKKDGTGDFTTIQQAINSITDAAVNKQYDIQVYDDFDITDLTQLWLVNNPTQHNASATAPTSPIALVITKNWVHIRGMGSPKRLYIESPTTLAADSFQNIQTIYPKGNVIINNFYVGIKGGRYAIHQESGGSKTSDDYHATTVYHNLKIEHKGNRAADGYTSNWTSVMAQANGTTSGLKMIYINCEWITVDTSIPYYSHSNADFDEPNELTFINCRMLTKGVFNMETINPYWGDIGSGQKSTIKIIGCNFGKFSITNSIRSTETVLTLANKWDCGGAFLHGYGNTPFVANTETPKVLSFKTINNNIDIKVTGGTAKDLIFGNILSEQKGATDAPGIVWGEIRIEQPGASLGTSQIFNLPYRLGNCATTPKTLIVNVGGTDYTITFNKNYMTADGSAFVWNTVPNLSLSSIIADINAAFPAVFVCSNSEQLQTYSFVDCMETGVNISSVTLKINKGVVRDYSVNTYNAWRLSQTGEKADGIVGQRINPLKSGNYFEGNIILTSKTLIPSFLLGLSVTGGKFYKCSADGAFVETTTQSEATFVALDNKTLRYIL